MNEKYVKLSDVKKKLNYIYRVYGVSQKIKQTISSALEKIPYTMVGELEVVLEAEPVKHGMQKVLENDLQQCISSFERMKKGGVGIADELVYQTCKRALEYIEKLDAEPEKHGEQKHVPGMNSKCSECGAKAFLHEDVVDGFWFGWSVGCPKFCLNDGIHGYDINTPREKRLVELGFTTKEEAVEWWEKRVKMDGDERK